MAKQAKNTQQRKHEMGIIPKLAEEAKAVVALAFRNGPIEDVHAGKPCPTCHSDPVYSRISDAEMKVILKNAVDCIYSLLWLKETKPEQYEAYLKTGGLYTKSWDEPALLPRFRSSH
jgi:hypothetical protein